MRIVLRELRGRATRNPTPALNCGSVVTPNGASPDHSLAASTKAAPPNPTEPPNPPRRNRRSNRPTASRLPDATEPSNPRGPRSEEHTSELQSRLHLVCRLLLEK